MIAMAKRLAALCLAGLSLALVACGDEGPPQPASPAALVPAGAPIYVEATVRPDASQRRAVEGLLARFPGGNRLINRLVDEVDSSLGGRRHGDDRFTFADDIQPWLGSGIGFFFTGSGEDPPAAAVFAVGDPAAATRVARDQPSGGRIAAVHLYRGLLYVVNGHGQTSVYLHGFLVAGDETAVRAAIDVARGDRPSLAASGALDQVRGDLAVSDPLVLARVELAALSNAVALPRRGLPAGLLSQPRGTGQLASLTQADPSGSGLNGTLTAALAVRKDAVTLETLTRFGPGLARTALPGGGGDPGRVLGALPAGSFIVAAVPGFGTEFAAGLEQGLGGQLGPFADPRALRNGLRQRLGFDPIGLFGALGDLGFFVDATDGSTGGAAVLGVDRRGPVERALKALPLLFGAQPGVSVAPLPAGLPGQPLGFLVHTPRTGAPFVVALAGDRLALAYGVSAAAEALAPSSTLAAGDGVRAARDALGAGFEPSVIVDVAGLLDAAKSLRGAGGGRGFSKVAPYLRPLDLLVAGSRTAGSSLETRLIATLRP